MKLIYYVVFGSSKNISSSCSKTDCAICAETVSQRKIVKCPFCDFECCDDCVTTFLMGIHDTQPRCMSNSCKKIWSGDFLADNTPHTFHNKTYRNRRADILYEREKSMLPGTQELANRERDMVEINIEVKELMNENAMLRELIKNNQDRIRELRYNQHDGFTETKNEEKKKEATTFTRACPVENCRGFLSTALKCGTCSVRACKDCHMQKDKNDDHKCDPGLVATVKLLASDTRPCPACATPIFKISGCDQMYCTSCHTPFSWKSGKIETGVIHNPHYYQVQKELNGGVAPRNRGDVRCGGPPNFRSLHRRIKKVRLAFPWLAEAHRSITHINQIEIPKFPNQLGDIDNSQLRVNYLLSKIDEKTWKSKLKAKMKKQEKDGEINQVLSMYTQTLSDLFGNMEECKNKDVQKHVDSCYTLREYTNKALSKIGNRFGNITPCISEKWKYIQNSKNVVNETLPKTADYDELFDPDVSIEAVAAIVAANEADAADYYHERE